jgi:hypothetical protein
MTDSQPSQVPSSIADELDRVARTVYRLKERGVEPTVEHLASELGWSAGKIRPRLLIVERLTAEVIAWSGLKLHDLKRLSLGRLLDAARKADPRDRAVCLAIAATGRRPEWVDRGEAPSRRSRHPSE